MRILLFGNSTWCLFNFRAGLISSLIMEGCEVVALAPLDPTYDNKALIKGLEDLGARFVEVPMEARGKNPFDEISTIFRVCRKIREIKPDVVLTFTIKCNLYTGLCRLFLPGLQIANVPGLGEIFARKDIYYRLVCLLYRIAFRKIKAVFFQNKEDLDFCVNSKLIPNDSGKLIPGSGVNLKNFVHRIPNKNDRPINFLMFGRLLPQKGYYNYLAAARILSNNYGKKVTFSILGIEDKNRHQSAALLKIIQEAANEGYIKLYKPLVDVRPILADADIVCLPSTYNEGIPRSLLEAMADSKAIVTTDWKGCRETVVDGRNGYLVKPDDLNSLIKAMESLIRAGRSQIEAMGVESRKLVEEKFNEENVIQCYLNEIFPARIKLAAPSPSRITDRPKMIVNSVRST